jgi:hypothetical protein
MLEVEGSCSGGITVPLRRQNIAVEGTVLEGLEGIDCLSIGHVSELKENETPLMALKHALRNGLHLTTHQKSVCLDSDHLAPSRVSDWSQGTLNPHKPRTQEEHHILHIHTPCLGMESEQLYHSAL